MKRLIAITAACSFLLAARAAEVINAPVFQLGLVVDKPSTNTEQMTVSFPVGNGTVRAETFDVQKMVAFDRSLLKSATVVENKRYPGEFGIQIMFNDEGQKQLAQFTRHNVSKKIAVILFDQLDSAPILKSEISNKMWVGSTKNEQKAKELASKINAAIMKQ